MTASPLLVLERAVQVHHALDRADVRHALGGALALAYHVAEARATRDIDLNVMSDPAQPEALFRLLPADVPWGPDDVDAVRRLGQVRLRWPHPDGEAPIPLDLFFPQHAFHDVVAGRTVLVAMLDATVPIVSATDLLVFKALFDRRKDWADIEELVRHGRVDLDEASRWIVELCGPDDGRVRALNEVIADVALDRGTPTPFAR